MGKQQDRLGSSALVRQLVWMKESCEFKPVKLRLKIDLVSYPARAEGLGKQDYCSIDACIVSVVYGRCNQSFSALFYTIFESLYRCINAIFNAGVASSSFFFKHIVCICHILAVRPYASYEFSYSLVHLLKFFPRPLQELSRVSYEQDSPGVYCFAEISSLQFGFEYFYYLFLFFLCHFGHLYF